MQVPLHEAARVLSEHVLVFEELWRRREDALADAELLQLIGSTQPAVGVGHVLGLLKRLRFVEPADAEGLGWRLAPAFKVWLQHLHQLAQPVSAGVVRARLEVLANGLEQFDAAVAKDSPAEALLVLADIRRECAALGEDLSQTHKAVIHAVQEAKAQHSGESSALRFQRINHLWNTFLAPVLPLLDPSGELEVCVHAWERRLDAAMESAFLGDSRAPLRVVGDFHFLRLVAARSFLHSCKELAPLHARLRRDSLLSEGAAKILMALERDPEAADRLQRSLPLSGFRIWGQISEAALLAQAARWREPVVDNQAIDFGAGQAGPAAQAVVEILSDVESLSHKAFPIEDLMAWLGTRHPQKPFEAVQEAFSTLATDAHLQPEFLEPFNDYELSGGAVRCVRVRIHKPAA